METKNKRVPLSQTQSGMYFESVRMGGCAYNRHYLYTLDESLDMERLAQAIEKTVQAHPYMEVRISQDSSNGAITQSIPKSQSQYHQTVERMSESQWRERLKTLISEPLTLNGGRLFRFDLTETECGKYMLRTTHHAAFDGMAHNIIMSDIAAAYNGKNLTKETYNALDAAEEEAKLRAGEEYQRAKEWYVKNFSGLDVVSSPLAENSGNNVSEFFVYPFDLSEAEMKKFCREKNISTSSLTSGAFAILTGIYTNQQEALFSTIYHGRSKNAANIVGMFVKTLPVYAKWDKDTRTVDFLMSLSEQIQGARGNDIFSFADVNAICPMNDAPLFAWHGAIRTHVEVCGMPASEELLDKAVDDTALSVDLMSVPSGLSLRAKYDSGRYTREFIETLAETYANVLRQLMTTEFLREIEPCPQGTKAGDLNDTDYPIELCAVHTLFEEQARNNPDTVAFVADGERLTYGELNGRANSLAHSLIERDIQPESIVGLLLPRTIAVPVCEYGVWKAGGSFLPMSAEYPDERIDICLRDAGCMFCITTEAVMRQRKNLFTPDKPYTALTVEELCRSDNAENPSLTVNSSSLAYVIYTSGSTGRPKGVMLEHGNLCNFVSANDKNMETREFIRGGKTALALAAVSFDVSMMEIHISLTHGMTCVMATEEEIHNPLKLAGLIKNEAVDVVCSTPSYFANLLQFSEAEEALHRVKMYDVGAEAFPPSLYGKIRSASPDAVIVNGYGPTEATISCVATMLSGSEKITIGRPSANVKAWVMDRFGHEIPAGAVGELVIGGLGVGRGYLNLPDKTSAAFFTHEGVRAYHTGDIVRLLRDDDGFNVDYIGRGDRQVKIRGLRIELDEVESVIRDFPGVSDAAVVAFDGDSGKFMAAYVVSSGEIDIPALNDFIRNRKPPYMIPSVTVQIDAIPLTPSHKVDRKALPKPEISAATSNAEIIQPRTDAEKRVCGVISEITGGNNFGVNMTLEEIGINSLAMMRLAIALSREFSHPLNFADIQQNNTPEKLAAFLEGVNDDDDFPVLDDYPLTKTQEGIFFETQSHPGTTIYNIATLLELGGTPDVSRIKSAVISAVKAHQYLLTRFFLNDKGEIRQKRPEDFAFDVEESQFRNLDELKKNLLRPYDLLNDRLIRANIARTDDGKIYVYFDMNHAVFDGMSLQIFLRDIERAYNGETLEPEKFSGWEAALLEERLRNTSQYQKAKDYYTGLFKDCEPDCLPLPDMQEDAEGSLTMILPGHADAEAIRKFCDDNGISENDFYTAAFGYVIAGFSGREDSIFTTINSGRSDSRFMDSVSMFVRTYPVICKTQEGTVLDYIRETKRQLTDSLSYSAYSFAEISHDLGITSDILFAFQGAVSGKIESFCGCPCSEVNVSLDESKAGIEMLVFPEDGGLSYHFTCRKNLYTEDFIRNFAGVYDKVLTEFMRKENLNDTEFLDAETESLLDNVNQTETDYDKSDIVTQFRRVAEKFPDNIAAVYKEKRYTYREADEITERIAAYLKGRGIGSEDVVSVLIPRCEYMVLASLGVLKSCAAYQPLDPSYPPERLEFMIKDASAKLLIADRNLIKECVPNYDGEILYTDEIPSLPPAQRLTENPSPSNLFIMLYTSGSTGVPKGVMLEHGNLACFIAWDKKTNNLTENSRVAEYASYGFDMHMMGIYPPLTAGATVYIIGEDMRLDFEALQKYIDDEGITHSFITTQVGRQFAEYYTGQSLKYLYVAGEKLAPVFPENKSFAFFNAYGPTETTMLVTFTNVKKLYRRVPIGAALDNLKLYVVDKNGRKLPPYMPGELWVSGHQVGRGYLNRPEKNAESFIANPFTNEEGYTKIYRTGDIVRNVYDGGEMVIDFVGRNDAQVKVRGFRIELTEVEAVIRDFPCVKDVTVQAFDSDSGEKYLAAYVVSDEPVDINALNKFVGDRKPPYMIPAVTMQIDSIPLNQNQKVNRKALPKPEITASRTEVSTVSAPLNVLEKDIKAIIAEITGTDSFGITDTLGNFGLTSISSIRLATQIYKKYGVQLQVRKLVSEGTVQSIENDILSKLLLSESHEEKAELPKPQESAKHSCGLTFEQQGVYTECQIDPSSTVYNTPFSVKIPDGVTAVQLKDAVRGVVEAHSYILCRFTANESNEIIQEPIPDFTLDIPEKEMSAQDFESYRKEGFVRPFNLSEGPLVRFEIVSVFDGGLYLLIDMHHLVTDGASIDIFLHQLCEKLDGQEIEREEYSYYDYAGDERMTEGADDFFAGRMALSDEATQIIPDVYGENLTHSEDSVTVRTDIKAVKEFALKNGATPAEIYLAAGYITFSRFVCNDTVSILTISNGRSNMKIHDTLGMFVNSLPLVETVDSSERVANFIKRAAKNFNDTLLHENYPFARTASKFDFHPSISYAYQIGVFNEYNTKYGELVMEELSLDKAKIPVAVFITGTEDEAGIKIVYDTALYSREIMQELAECYENAVRGLLTKDKISDISITNSRQWEILDSYNPEWDLNYDMSDTPVSAFRRNAKKNPDKVATVFMDKQYTYRELDELTDRLAAKIYGRMKVITGKEKLSEEVVSIIIPRNENVFILPLAVVKTGCAYQPLDPSYPQERLNFMVKDSGAKLLIADDSLRGLVNEYHGEVLLLSELYGMDDSTATPPSPSPEDLFVMLYTSGSTGTPKGCQIEHRNVVALAHGIGLAGFYREDDRIADYASFGFDVNMADVFCTLINGGTVHIISEDIRMNLDLLAKYFDDAGITALLLTTQVGVQFMQNYPNCKTLRLLIIAGEKLPAVDPAGLSYQIANGYGPTENCYGVSLFPIRKWEQNIPVGKPFRTIHGYILDKVGHRLPAGAAGEYCLSGPQVSRGYLNRPDKTAEAYEACPFNEWRMYHTGDIVRYRQDGNVEFVGRKDGQVKIRGFRIETKEIEAVIRNFSGVKDATVQAYDYESGGKYLAAFVVSDETIDTAKLADYIKSQKPAYMVPAVIMQIDKVPLTVNQKVDRKALPKPELQRREYVAPSGKAEEDFCGIFGEILGLERVGAEDDFFELGGSSVIAMKVVIAAGKKGYSIVYNDVFKYTTPSLLAEFVTGSTGHTKEITASVAPSAGKITEVDEDGYDYSAINALLAKNTMEAFRSGKPQELGDVLLAGATGYLGIHVLEELLTSTTAKVFCLIRQKDNSNGEKRLKNLLEYYFGNDHAEYFASRINVIEGDATNPDSLRDFAPASNMTVINCAASVKHFAKGREIEHANLDSVKNLVAWCEENNSRLVHISTGSIIGGRQNGIPPEGYRFDEHVLFAGQTVKFNQYIHSKFMAERFIYEEILTHGLSAKVFRVGNLAPRLSDGKFQVNFRTNNIMNTLRAYKILGLVNFGTLAEEIEFSPIDCLAKAVIALAGTPKECVCFMPINPHRALMQDVFTEICGIGCEIRTAEDDELKQALDAALSDSRKNSAVAPLVAYTNNSGVQGLGYESLNTGLTSQILYRLGFSWPETGSEYIGQFIRKLEGLSFFDE